MKSKISQATKKSVSLLLAILMMFSMLTVGLTVTVNAADTKTIYFDNSGDTTRQNWTDVYIWGWKDGEGKNYKMTPVDGVSNLFSYTFTETDDFNKCIFKKGENDWSDQTSDQNIPTDGRNKYISSTNTWVKYESATPEPTPAKTYYYGFWRNDANPKHQYRKMNHNNGVYTYDVVQSTGEFQDMNNGYFSFKITNADVSGDNASMNSGDTCVNYNIGTDKIQFMGKLANQGYTVAFENTNYYNLLLPQDAFSKDTKQTLVIKYVPDTNTGLAGDIEIWTKDEYGTPTPTPTDCFSIKPTSLSNMGVSEVAPITATHSNCAGTLTWTVTEGTDVISIAQDSKDTNTYKVTALKPGTAKITITCSETSESVECPVEVKRLPFAETGRIYAYAGRTAPTDTTLVSDAWIAAEKANNQLSIYGNNSSSAEIGAVKKYPTLGSASESALCVYLPSSAAADKVTLYNASEGNLVVGDKTIASGNYGEVSYTDGVSQNITLNGASKTLTVYRSNATGALYLNNSDKYVGNDSNGVPNMITQLYKGKDKGEIGKNTGNYGAYTDNSGTVKFAGVSKVKGRGNSTWKYTDKKSFNVTFTDKFNAFGFTDGGKKYSLLANFKDPSLSRNKILYQLGKDVFGVKYVPKTATVDLYMNGLYMGSYLMTQKIEVGSKEVVNDIDENTLFEKLYTDASNQTSDIQTKGFSFLMELDSNASNGSDTTDADYYVTTDDNKKVTIKEPEYDGTDTNVDNAIKEFVKTKYNQLKSALENKSINYDDLNAIVDVDSLTRYFLLNEFAKNYDIGVSSTYFVYKRDVDANGTVLNTGKFYASPVWDMDVTASNCEKTNNNYSSYEGDWSNNNNNDWNVIMKAAFGNPVIQNAADAIWTPAFYTTLTSNIKTLATNAKTDLKGSYENNFRKWTYPYDFNGQDDNVQPHTSLDGGLATFNVSNADYTQTTSYDGNIYSKTALEGGQIDFLEDWLLSRAAWMTKKYNDTITSTTQDFYIERYYDESGGNSGSSHYVKMVYDEVSGTYSSEVNFAENQWTNNGNTVYRFGIVTEDGASRTDTAKSVTAYKGVTNIDDYVTISDTTGNLTGVTLSTYKDVDLAFANSTADLTYIVTYKPGTGNILDGKITITKKSTTTITQPKVSIVGSQLDNENIVLGTPITITATVTPLKENDVVVEGEYTVTLYRGTSVVKTDKITFTATDAQKEYTFNTELNSNDESYKVEVTKDTYSATSNTVAYKQTGVKDIKIYFDPSEKWLSELKISSTVTATAGGKTFTMSIDPGDDNALAKGVFRAMIDSDTLEAIKANGVTFTLDNSETAATITATADASANVSDGDIYTLDKDNGDKWCSYNKTVEPAYPGGCQKYEDFVTYLKNQMENDTDHIVYFDNSASKWYNVYIYCWTESGQFEYADSLKKLPYADIWYYNFGETNRTSRFLFKDRSTNAYGIDYQQTVDLVGHIEQKDQYVYNANGDQVYLNFENTIDTPNPIFITANFYKCTTTGASGNDGSNKNNTLKYRAFNTEWKEFGAVIDAQVKTKAVTVYFDIHRKDVADVQLYHTSTDTSYTFASTFTRLTPLPGSTIYSATMQLPYKVVNGSVTPVFTFDKFIIGTDTTEYPMSSAVQPKGDCFTTGEVWYEYNGKTPANEKSVVSTSANAKTLVATGANVSTVSTGWSLSDATLYFQKPDSWNTVRLVIGTGSYRKLIEPNQIINGNIYKFTGISWTNYSGFFFIDLKEGYKEESSDYWGLHSNSSNVTDAITGNDSNYFYSLVSGTSGPVNATANYKPDYTCPAEVLGGTNVMFYSKKPDNYNNGGQGMGVYNTTTGYTVANATDAISNPAAFNVPKSEYSFTNNSGANGTSSDNGNGWSNTGSKKEVNGGYLYSWTSGSIIEAETKSGAAITANNYADGTVTTTTSGSTSSNNLPLYVLYYAKDGSNYTKIGETAQVADNSATAVLDTSALSAGTYTVKSVLTDGTIYYLSGSDFNVTITTPTIDTFTVNGSDSAEITLNGDPASATATLAIQTSNATGKTVTYSVTKDDASTADATVSADGKTFTATKAGTYEVTASLEGASETKSVTITVNAPAEDVYRVAGAEALCGSSWDASDDNNKMTYNSVTGRYEKVYTNVATGTYEYKVVKNGTTWIPEGNNNNQSVTVTEAGSTVTVWYKTDGTLGADVSGGTQPTYSVNLDNTSLSLDLSGTTSATLTANTTGFTQSATVTWNSDNKAVATVVDGVVTAVGVGTTKITVTYQEGGNTKTATCNVTVTNSSVPTVDYCGILGYTHSTATFESTTGGSITDAYVELKNGYYQDAAYKTGYAITTDGVTTVIYAIPTEKDGATTVYKSTTTGDTGYLFNEWTKDGAFLTSVQDLTTANVTTTNTVSYVANWSQVQKVQYTFTYKYQDQDKSKGMEYNPQNLIEKEYVVTVMLDENASDDVIKAAFRANAPKLSSDYYSYSFDSVDVAVSGTTASATAAKTVKEYSVTIRDNDGQQTTLNTKYNYQNLVTLTAQGTLATGYRFVWKYAGTNSVIGYGNSISIRITDDLAVEYMQEKTATTSPDYTILHKPTYEFFTSGNVEKVRFNFLVENTVVDKDNFAEFGILYFFTDEKGVNSNVYADANVPADTLKDIVLGNTKLADVKVKKIEKYNFKNEYIFNAAMTNSDANLEKYVRVYSYIKFKDGRVVLSDTTTPVLGSLKEARLA